MTQYRGETDKRACYQNPVLGPDAWFQVINKRPRGDGAKAAVVCRFACKVRDSCPFGDNGYEVVANGGGWFGADGSFIKPPSDMLEFNQAAAYLGIHPDYLGVLMRLKRMVHTKGPSNNTFVYLRDVEQIAINHGPRHGSLARHELHLLRGEVPCYECRVAQRKADEGRAGVL